MSTTQNNNDMNFSSYKKSYTAATADRAIKNGILNNWILTCAVPTSYYQCDVEALCWDLDLLFGAE